MQTLKLPRWELLPDIGLYMDQVITLMERTLDGVLPKGEMTKSMVNNYVKFGLLKRPVGKKYDREHLAALLEIAVLKQALSMERIAVLLQMLGASGAREGYERFCSEIRTLEDGVRSGQGHDREMARELALHTGIAAAVCTISANRQLDALGEKEEENREKTERSGA